MYFLHVRRAIPPPLLSILFLLIFDMSHCLVLMRLSRCHLHQCFSQVSVIIVISELVLCISLLIKYSLCLSDLAFTVDTLIVQTISSLLLLIVGTCLRFLISAFLFGLVC